MAAVGSTPPRSKRGRTLLPEGSVTVRMVWAGRVFWFLVMLVFAPVSLPVAGWWLWGNRSRLWRWRVSAAGLVSGLVALLVFAKHVQPLALTAGITPWLHLAHALHIGHLPTPAGHVNVLAMLLAGWFLGTVVGSVMSFFVWLHTPPWRDRPRPMTWLARRRKDALVASLAAGAGDVDGVITFGYDTDTGAPVELPWADTSGHTLVVGSPGSGKTTTSLKMVRAAIRDGMFTAVVDMKGSPKMIEQVAGWCAKFNRPLWVFSVDGPSRYDPFASGDYNRKRDLLMATSQWSESHYQAKAADYLLTVFYALEIVGVPANQSWLHTVTDLLNPPMLARLAATLPEGDYRTVEARARIARVLDEYNADPRSLAGLGPRVRALTDTVMGRWLQPGEPSINLEDIWEQGGVVMFSLPSLTYPEAAAAFGGLAVQDLKTLAGTLQARGNTTPGLVFVDEFATLGAHNVTTALAMARESGLRWALATQDLGDLAVGEDGRAFVQKILTDTNIKIVHTVGDPQTATRLAQLAGEKWGTKERSAVNEANSSVDYTTSTMAGAGYVDQLLIPVIEANDILNQPSGEQSEFTLINKQGMWAVTGARTVRDESPIDLSVATVPLHLPGTAPMPGAVAPVSVPDAPEDAPAYTPVPIITQQLARNLQVAPEPAPTLGSSPLASGFDADSDGFWDD